MTDNEIKKALEDTLHRIKGAEQLIVPEQGVKNLCYGLQNFLYLINRKDEELKRLQAENERLKEEIKKEQLYNLRMTAHSVKSEAYKEFAERLKKESYERIDLTAYVEVSDIDNLLKELVGEDNG